MLEVPPSQLNGKSAQSQTSKKTTSLYSYSDQFIMESFKKTPEYSKMKKMGLADAEILKSMKRMELPRDFPMTLDEHFRLSHAIYDLFMNKIKLPKEDALKLMTEHSDPFEIFLNIAHLKKKGIAPQLLKYFLLEMNARMQRFDYAHQFFKRYEPKLLERMLKIVPPLRENVQKMIDDLQGTTRHEKKIIAGNYQHKKTLNENIGKLHDSSLFLSEKARKEIDDEKWPPGFKLEKEENNRFLISPDGKKYQITEAPWYRDQFPFGVPRDIGELNFTLVGDHSQKNIHVNMLWSELDKAGSDEKRKIILEAKLKLAFENNIQQSQKADLLTKYDLPKDKPIAFLSFNETDPDLITEKMAEVDFNLAGTLKDRGYQMATFVEKKAQSAYDIEKTIDEQYQKGIRNFYLTFNYHGSPHGLSGLDVPPEKLFNILKKYPDCQFCISSIACMGGGLREGLLNFLKANKNFENKITLLLQSKPYSANIEGRIKTESGEEVNYVPYSTYYNMMFESYLIKGYSIGEAAHRADLEVQKYVPSDAEAIVEGQLITHLLRTAPPIV